MEQVKDPQAKQGDVFKNIALRAHLISRTEDLAKADEMKRKNPVSETVATARDEVTGALMSWVDLWNNRQKYIRAGIGPDNFIAIEGMVTCAPENNLPGETLAIFTRDYFRKLCGEDNVLSCEGGKISKGTFCHFLLYPLDMRQLNPYVWLDNRSRQFKPDTCDDFITKLVNAYGLDYHTEKVAVNNGHTKYLDEFPIVITGKTDVDEIFYNTITEESQLQTDFPRDKVRAISEQTIKAFTTGVEKGNYIKLNNGDIGLDTYLYEADKFIQRNFPSISQRDKEIVLRNLNSSASGFYILDDLINDPRISDIKVCAPNKIRVKVEGQRRTSNLHFIDMEDYARFINGIMLRYGRDPEEQIHVFTDTICNRNYILRCNLTLSDINTQCPVFHIRKVPKTKYRIEDLIRLGVMDETVANYLIWAARNAKGMVFTGKGSSGKTTLMNTLLEYTPSDASGLVIQESDELFSNKPEMTFEHITPQYDLKALSRNGLLTDIDYFIIGEVKGDEAMYFINACDTGNKGWCSVHSPNSTEAINKLADYVMYASKYSRDQAREMLKELQVIVFMKSFKVTQISEVVGWDDVKKDLIYRTVYNRVQHM